GCGGTLAMIWLADKVRIWTLRDGKVMHDDVVWSRVMKAETLAHVMIGADWERATINNTPAQLLAARHGTMIEMNLRRERMMVIDAVERELARTYAPGLRAGRKITIKTIDRAGRESTQELIDEAIL